MSENPYPSQTQKNSMVSLRYLVTQAAGLLASASGYRHALVYLQLPPVHELILATQNRHFSLKAVPKWLAIGRLQTAQPKELEWFRQHCEQQPLRYGLGIPIQSGQKFFGSLWLLDADPKAQTDIRLLSKFIGHITTLIECARQHAAATRERDFAFSVAHSLPIGLIVTDLSGHIQYINHAYTAGFGYSFDEIKNQNLLELTPSEYQAEIALALAEHQRGETTLFRYQMYRKDGNLADVELLGKPYYDSQGKPLGNVVITRDISEELALEKATLEARRAINKKLTSTLIETKRSLEAEKNFAYEVMDALLEGVALLDLQGRFLYANPAFCAICGIDATKLKGMNAEDFVFQEDLETVKQQILRASEQHEQVLRLTHRIKRSDGAIRTVQAKIQVRLSSTGEVQSIILMVRDISEQLRSSAKVQELERELERIQGRLQSGAGFSGRLETVGGVLGLLQMLSVSAIDGAFQLDDSVVFFARGRVVSVVHPKLFGYEAVRAIAQRQRGQFQFIPKVQPAKLELNLDPTKIVLELATENDLAQAVVETPQIRKIALPNVKAARAFMRGVGGEREFTARLEGDRVLLEGKLLQIEVLEARIADFADLKTDR
ncbi:MAG: PAS domain S-box protein [Deinococcales bacterium]